MSVGTPSSPRSPPCLQRAFPPHPTHTQLLPPTAALFSIMMYRIVALAAMLFVGCARRALAPSRCAHSLLPVVRRCPTHVTRFMRRSSDAFVAPTSALASSVARTDAITMMAAAKKKAPVKKAAPKKVVAKKPAKKVAPKKSSKSSGSPSLLVKKAGYDCFLNRK